MFKRVLVGFTLLFSIMIWSQNPDIYGTWALYGISFDTGGELIGSEIEPEITPTLTINPDLTFEGFGACNTFSGNFVYDEVTDTLLTENYSATNTDCGFSSHNSFESNYFVYFLAKVPLDNEFAIYQDNQFEFFKLGVFDTAGYMILVDPLLNSKEDNLIDFMLYPNPVENELHIQTNEDRIQQLQVYDFNGRQIDTPKLGLDKIDVSELPSGLYFVEIQTQKGIQLKKFIKK